MTTPLDVEIRRRIAAVLRGDESLRDFYAWFAPVSVQDHRERNPEALRLTYALAHLFAELDAGGYPVSEIKRDLRRIASTYVATAAPWYRPRELGMRATEYGEVTRAPTIRLILGRPRAAAPA